MVFHICICVVRENKFQHCNIELQSNENFQESVSQNEYHQTTDTAESIHFTDKIYDTFQSEVANGPTYVCTPCTQTFFRHSVCMTSLVRFNNQHMTNVRFSNININMLTSHLAR